MSSGHTKVRRQDNTSREDSCVLVYYGKTSFQSSHDRASVTVVFHKTSSYHLPTKGVYMTREDKETGVKGGKTETRGRKMKEGFIVEPRDWTESIDEFTGELCLQKELPSKIVSCDREMSVFRKGWGRQILVLERVVRDKRNLRKI